MFATCTFDQATYLSLSASAAKPARRFRLRQEEIQDVQQDAIARLIKYVTSGHHVENPFAWVSKAAHNLCLDMYRKKKGRKEVVFSDFPEMESFTAQEQVTRSPKIVMIDNEPVEMDCDSIECLVSCLIQKDKNTQRRQVAEMWFVLELNAAEIAERTGLSHGTIRSHVSRFRQMVKEGALALAKSH